MYPYVILHFKETAFTSKIPISFPFKGTSILHWYSLLTELSSYLICLPRHVPLSSFDIFAITQVFVCVCVGGVLLFSVFFKIVFNLVVTLFPVWLFLPPVLFLHFQEDVSCQSPHSRAPHSLGSQVSPCLGASSLTEARPGSPLLCMCLEPHISLCMLPGWWLNVWEISAVQVSWDCSFSYGVALLLSFFQSFPNLTTGFPVFCPLVMCRYLSLTNLWSGPLGEQPC